MEPFLQWLVAFVIICAVFEQMYSMVTGLLRVATDG